MKLESVIFGICGMFFGLLVGWMLGDQYATGSRAAPPAPVQASAPATPAASSQAATAAAPAAVNETRAQELRAAAERNPNDLRAREELGNLYFDAERYPDAIRWYQEALKLNPRDVNISTDLGVSYYYSDQPDKALEQFDRSLAIDPKHLKTLLNVGIVKAFGKQDLEGAARVWQQLIDLAPSSPEGRAAQQAIDSMKSAHPGGDTTGTAAPKGGNE